MDRFVALANVRYLSRRLRTEIDSAERRHLQKLLLEEEDRLGRDAALIAEMERAIAGFDALIKTQTALVAAFERDGSDSLARARDLLDGLIQSQALHIEYYRQIAGKIRARHA